MINAVGPGHVHHALCAVKRRAGREFAAGGEHEAAALCHGVDLVAADLIPLLVRAEHNIGRRHTADQRDLVAVFCLALRKILAVVRRIQEGDRGGLDRINLHVKVNLFTAVVDHIHAALGAHSRGQLAHQAGLHLDPHVLGHDRAGGEQRVPHDCVHPCVAQRLGIVLERRRDLACRTLDRVRVVVQVHVHGGLVAQHGQRPQRAEYKRHDRLFVLEFRNKALAHINVHHHALTGAVIHLFDFFVILDILDHAVFIVRMCCILLGIDQLLPPRRAFDRKVDQRDHAVQIVFADSFDISVCAGFCIRGPFFVASADQLARHAGKDRIGRHPVCLLMVERRYHTFVRIHCFLPPIIPIVLLGFRSTYTLSKYYEFVLHHVTLHLHYFTIPCLWKILLDECSFLL